MDNVEVVADAEINHRGLVGRIVREVSGLEVALMVEEVPVIVLREEVVEVGTGGGVVRGVVVVPHRVACVHVTHDECWHVVARAKQRWNSGEQVQHGMPVGGGGMT